ncbi:hypothetical protein KNU79_gp44 [Gordonia phage NadineRae]|uniref:Uncharacterized protein n=1 Tax=Gordonia phage NadineRae TaxID=2652882 RepID=A0A5P8DFM8_9CAUD|nr:hypothetical protein KNU79_gp44 [Gordonia phage NadineRae]QFP97776.1 hypothetical protein SEA_NADINERAE_44 [Gordonia phage NadineRae]
MWTPTPEPTPDVNPGLGWSLDGVNAPAVDPVQGWFVKKQLLALMESSAEFRAGIKAILTGQHTAQAYSTAAIVAHLVGIAPSRSLGGGEGEALDALVKAYLTGWVNTLGTFTARGVFSPQGHLPCRGGVHRRPARQPRRHCVRPVFVVGRGARAPGGIGHGHSQLHRGGRLRGHAPGRGPLHRRRDLQLHRSLVVSIR